MSLKGYFEEAVKPMGKLGGAAGMAVLTANIVMLTTGNRLWAALPIGVLAGAGWYAYYNLKPRPPTGPQPGPTPPSF